MPTPEKIATLTEDLPDREAARRFYAQFAEKNPGETKKILKNEGLLSDALALAAFSPLLAATMLQNPAYVAWLARQRKSSAVRDKAELLESLARFALTHTSVEPPVLLANFRRRELLRIYLRDIRRLGSVAEITGEISHLADAILEYALRLARQEMDNRYGIPLEIDEKGRAKQARFAIVALGKLGSNELNYSSDIDLLFLYSAEGATSGQGAKGKVTNREYFIKLAEFIVKLVGHEGGAYRVDLRLRPHGRVGALAIFTGEAINYYRASAQSWERQTLIRSRAAAGDADVFKTFFAAVENYVFSKNETIENALAGVRRSKEKINLEKISDKGFNVKLGRGGIREIEFVAQALQLAYGGRDSWLRAPHTLISLARLADRKLLSETELTALADAYDFLRRLEHRLQMEHGLQTHLIGDDREKRALAAKRMNCPTLADFESSLEKHAANVSRIFRRVFGDNQTIAETPADGEKDSENKLRNIQNSVRRPSLDAFFDSLERTDAALKLSEEKLNSLDEFCRASPVFAELLKANPSLAENLPTANSEAIQRNYREIIFAQIENETDFAREIGALRKVWSPLLLEIAAFDVFGKINLRDAKQRQTELAESSLAAAFFITKRELARRYDFSGELDFAVLALGKLGGRGMDYGSDLDLILIYDDEKPFASGKFGAAEFYARAAEIFVNALSSFTRDGHLYRVDLRLRPDGKNGATCQGKNAFLTYLAQRSAIWEWLAYVKLRGVGGNLSLARETEFRAREIIHARASEIENDELKTEIRRVRERLEAEKSARSRDVDIKFGAGGMLDVYFAARYLQLRDRIFDEAENRATVFTLEKLLESNSLAAENFSALRGGYEFLSCLDHNLRLTVGRSTHVPAAQRSVLEIIAARMNLAAPETLFEQMTIHRLNIRHAFENIFEQL